MPSVLLLAGGVLGAFGALLGTAHSFDGSRLGSVPAATWVVLLPAVVVLAVGRRRPLLGLTLCAGAGLAAVGRLLSDFGVLTDPGAAVRPELFYELTTRAQPFTAAAGAGVLVAGDVVLVLAGALAARMAAARLAVDGVPIFDRPSPTAAEVGATAPDVDTPARTTSEAASAPAAGRVTQGPELLVRAWEAENAGPAEATFGRSSAWSPAGADSARNNGLIVAGFVGVLLLVTGSLGLPYSGGYLADRYLPAELGAAGIGSALAVALAATIAVLVAAVLPRRLSVALLGGVALTAAVPLLTALVVRLAGAPVQLTVSVWVGLPGAAVLGAAGLVGNGAPMVDDYDVPTRSVLRRTRWVGATLSLVSGTAALAAWRLPQLRYNGGADPALPGGYAASAPLSAPFVLAAAVPLLAAALWLLPAVGAAGRAIATVGWLPLVFAATQTLFVLGQLVSSASVPNAVFAAPQWTAGPGLWWGVGGIVTGIGAALMSVLAARQSREASTVVPQEESLARSRAIGGQVAAVLAVVTLIVVALPVYRTTAASSGTVLVGFDVRSWGVLGLGAGMIAAAVAGGRAVRPTGAVGFLLAGASISLVRLVVPASVRASDGFSLGAGWYAGWGTAVLFVLAAVFLAVVTRRIVLIDAGVPDASGRSADRPGGRGRKPAKPVPGRAGGKRPIPARPVGKRTSAGASSRAKGRA